MSSRAVTAKSNTHIIEQIPLMIQHRVHHHIPVINENRWLVGIATQTELVPALYHRQISNLRTLGLSS